MRDAAPHLFVISRVSDQGGGAVGGGGGGRGNAHREPRHPGHVRREHGEPGEQHHHHVLGVTQSQPGILFFLKAYDMQRS